MISKEDFSRLLNWYCSGTLTEEDSVSPVLNSKNLPEPMPVTTKEFVDSIRKLAGPHFQETVMALFLADGSEKIPTAFMSGEIVGGEFVYTVKETQIDRMTPVPAPFMCEATEQELKQAGKDGSMPVSFTDGGTRYSIKAMRLDTVRFPESPEINYFMAVDLTEKQNVPKQTKAAGGSVYTQKRPVTAGDLFRELTSMQKRSGRAILDMPFVCRYEESMFGARPLNASGKQVTFLLAKATEPSDLEGETMTFKEVCQWLYRKDCLGATMFFKNRNDVYEIEDIVYEAGMPPFVDLRPWGQMDESTEKLSGSKREILEWKKYCDSDMLYW